jgi:CheY-like chemotaxis protein
MAKEKTLHDIATKVMTAQLSLEVVIQKIDAGWVLDADDSESIRLAFEAAQAAADLVRKARNESKVPPAKFELPPLPSDRHRSMLIVDDDNLIRKLLIQIFNNAGYVVHSASNSVEALELLKEKSIDVVLTDLHMPGGDGGRLADEIRKMEKQPVLCLMSGDTEYLEAIQNRVQPEGTINKPFSQKHLIDEVYRAQVVKGE